MQDRCLTISRCKFRGAVGVWASEARSEQVIFNLEDAFFCTFAR